MSIENTLGMINNPTYPCSRCGKNMKDPQTGDFIIGITIKRKDSPFLREQFGVFTKDHYDICFECLLLALGANQ